MLSINQPSRQPKHRQEKNKLSLLLLSMVCGLCALPVQAMVFEDISLQAGITATHRSDKAATGIAVADFDHNGFPDIFVTGYFDDSFLYMNQGNRQFVVSPFNAQINPPSAKCGSVAAADYDNDGWSDLYVACFGRNYLYRNDKGRGFIDVTMAAGVNHNSRTEAVAWGDLNGDGHLDLVVANYPDTINPDPAEPDNYDRVFFSNGDGTFTNIAHVLEQGPLLQPTLAAIISDIDLDGDQDIWIGNDKEVGNSLWRNDGPGCGAWCFTEVSTETGVFRPAYTMGVAIGDCDRDGDWDIAYSSIAEQILLEGKQAQGSFTFDDISIPSGFTYEGVGWGTIFFDGNNDGWEDLFLSVITVFPGTTSRLYRNDKNAQFTDVTDASNLGRDQSEMAVTWLDIDRDGLLDLVHGQINLGYKLDRNMTANTGNWIGFRLEGGGAINRDAVGTRIKLTMMDGSEQLRELHAGESRGSNLEYMLHFGLGEDTEVQSIEIRWTDGLTEVLPGLPVNQYHKRVYPPVETILAGDFEV